MASGVSKPDGLLVVPVDDELGFLHPLPVERLWGVGAVTSAKLRAHGITRVGEVAMLSEDRLVELVGRATGRQLHALAHNRDPRRVQPGRRRGSIGSQRALGRRKRSPEEIDAIVVGLVERICRRLRAADRIGRTVVLRLRFDDFSRATRSRTLPHATSHTETVLDTVRWLLELAEPVIAERGLTLVGISVANLQRDRPLQPPLPFDAHASIALDATLDEVRERFGSSAITRAVLLGRDEGLTVPLLPD